MIVRTSTIFALLIGLCLAFVPQARAQLDFSISPTPIGSGARAAGMADAFSAVADDATAASWNPAGLVQLEEPELSIVGEYNSLRDRTMANEPMSDNDGEFSTSTTNLNFASITYPLPRLIAGRNAVISLTHQQRFDLDRSLSAELNKSTSVVTGGGTTLFENELDYDVNQDGKLSVLSPAFGIELTERLSIGVAVNFWGRSFVDSSSDGWERTIVNETFTKEAIFRPDGTLIDAVESTETFTTDEAYEDFSGENFTIGLLWNPHPKWNLALRYDSGFQGDLRYTRRQRATNVFGPVSTTNEKQWVRVPDTWTFGVAHRPSDRLTLALQASYTDWNDFYITEADGSRVSLIDGLNIDDPATETDFDATWSVRFGAEYVFIPKDQSENLDYLWIARGGLIWDQEPASGRKLTGLPSRGDGEPDDFYGAAVGVGLQIKQRVNLDLAYQVRYGDDVKSDRVTGLRGFKEDLFQQRVILSTIVYF